MQTKTLVLAFAVTMANLSFAQPLVSTPTKPATAATSASAASANTITALCNDGSTFTGDTKKGACTGHKGVKTWTSDETTKSEKKGANAKNDTPVANAAPGGGAGKVWVNTKSNVYHCSTDRYYGKTKKGEYMSESEAKAKGARADHGKSCA